MALDPETIAPEPSPFAWNAAPGAVIDRTSIPRGEIRFVIKDGVIPLSAVGDNQALTVQCTLPNNWAYVLMDLFLSIRSTVDAEANGWGATALAILLDSLSDANYEQRFAMVSDSIGNELSATEVFETRAYHPPRLPTVTMVPPASATGPFLQVDVLNATANQGAYQVQFLARFLQYDYEQAHDFRVNQPFLIR